MSGLSDGADLPGGGKTTGWGANAGDAVISALVKPVDGIAVSADWAYNGENKSFKVGEDSQENKGVVGGALDVNVGTLCGLDFNLGISATDRYEYEIGYNVFAATVYGGVDVVDAFVEYALRTQEGFETEHYLIAQVNINVLENFPIDVYFGANNLTDFANTYIVGGDIGYEINGVGFNLGIEYSKGGSYNYDNTGLVIVPSVAVSF